MRYVLIGNSIASANAVEAIRKNDKKGEIFVIDCENEFCYSRPLISYYLSGETEEERMYYRPKEYFKKNNVNLLTPVKATKINPSEKTVHLDSSEKSISYDRLLVATGGKPFVPPMEGIEGPGIYTFTNLTDAKLIEKKLEDVKHAVILGGGLIGIKSAHALLQRGVSISIVELGKSLMPLALDEKSGKLVSDYALSKNIDIRLENTISKINRNSKGKIKSVDLSDGQKIKCDMVVVAVGVRPNLELAVKAGAQTDRGLLVNRYQETSLKDIYSAGDVCQGYDFLVQDNRVIAILPVAAWQGYTAGINMSGGSQKYEGGMPMNSVDVFGLPIISVGVHRGENYQYVERFNPKDLIYKKLVLKNGKLAGFILVNEIDRAGILTGLIKDREDVSKFINKLIDEEIYFGTLPRSLREDKLFRNSVKDWIVA